MIRKQGFQAENKGYAKRTRAGSNSPRSYCPEQPGAQAAINYFTAHRITEQCKPEARDWRGDNLGSKPLEYPPPLPYHGSA